MPEEIISKRRRNTRNAVYQYLYDADVPRTRQDIAETLSLSLPTVYQNLKELMDIGLVRTVGAQKSTGGRPAIGLGIHASARFAIGIALTERYTRICAVDLRLNELAYQRIQENNAFNAELGPRLAGEIEAFLSANGLQRNQLLGIGIGIPALLDVERETVLRSTTMEIQESSLRALFGAIDYPIFVENAAKCAGAAECFFNKEQKDLAYLLIEDSIGGAVISDGKVYDGKHNQSGTFGHICVERNGRPCRCGKRGCLNAYCSAGRPYRELGLTNTEYMVRLNEGDEACKALWEECVDYLAYGIDTIQMILDSDIVLGGTYASHIAETLDDLVQRVDKLNAYREKNYTIRIAKHPTRAVVNGAALHFIRDFLDNL